MSYYGNLYDINKYGTLTDEEYAECVLTKFKSPPFRTDGMFLRYFPPLSDKEYANLIKDI